MKHLSKGSRLIVFVITLSIVTGCAISGGKVPRTKLAAPTAGDHSKLTLSWEIILSRVNFIYSLNSSQRNSLVKELSAELSEELNKTQYFKAITKITKGHSVKADIDLIVTLTITNNPGPDVLGFMSMVTLGTVPYWETIHYEIRARVKNKQGLEKEYKLENSVTFGLWLPLWCFYRFTYDEGGPNVRRNIYRNIIQQMYEDGFIGEI